MLEVELLQKSSSCKNICSLKKVYEGETNFYMLFKHYEMGDLRDLIESGAKLSEPQLRLLLA